MSLNQANAYQAGRNECLGVPVDGLKKVMIDDAPNIAGRSVNQAKTNLTSAIDQFDKASETIFAAADRLHSTSDELAQRAKVAVSRAKDAATQMSDAMLRITKLLGPDFEVRIVQLERLADAMERLGALEKNGQLGDVIKALSKPTA